MDLNAPRGVTRNRILGLAERTNDALRKAIAARPVSNKAKLRNVAKKRLEK